MPDAKHGAVKLRELISSRDLRELEQLHLASTTSPVRDVALVTDIEEIATVGPDTIVVLTQDVARGGWMISAALRYAWERRACALVAPRRSFTATVIELARRLGLSLFTTDTDMTRVSLDIALQLGIARAGSLARLQAFHDRLSGIDDLAEALELVSAELDGAPVAVEHGTVGSGASGSRAAESGEAARIDEEGRDPRRSDSHERRARVVVALDPGTGSSAGDGTRSASPSGRGEPRGRLVASVSEHDSAAAEQVLAMAAPAVRALLLASRLAAVRSSLPLISIAALAGAPADNGIDAGELQRSVAALDWPIAEHWAAVRIVADAPDRVGHAIHQLWDELFPRVPIARLRDGWVGFVPVADERARRDALARLHASADEHSVLRRSLGLGLGVSRRSEGPGGSADGVREAWYAARLADPARPEHAVVDFESVPLRLLPRALPAAHASHLAESLLPRLVQDPAANDLIAALLAYLEHHGSATAASAALGVHRNTLQSRLRRAQELGAPLDDPAMTLPLHMLLAALRRGEA